MRSLCSLLLIYVGVSGGTVYAQETPPLHNEEAPSNNGEEAGYNPYNIDPTSYCKPFKDWSKAKWEVWRQSLFEARSTDMGFHTVAPGTREDIEVENIHVLMKPLSFCLPEIRKKLPELFAQNGCFHRTEDIFRLWAMKGEEAQVRGLEAYPLPEEAEDKDLKSKIQRFSDFAVHEILEASPNRSERLDDEIRLNEIRLGSEQAPAALKELYSRAQTHLGIENPQTPVWAVAYKSPVFGEELAKASMTFHTSDTDYFTSINQREDSFSAFGQSETLNPESIAEAIKLTEAENKKKEAHGLRDSERNKLATMIVSQKIGDTKINRFIMAHNNEGINLVERDIATEMSCLRCHISGKTIDVRSQASQPLRFPPENGPKSLDEFNSSLQKENEKQPLTILSEAEKALNEKDWPGLGSDANIATYCLTTDGSFSVAKPQNPQLDPSKQEAYENYQRTLTELQTSMNCASCHAKDASSFAILTPLTAATPAEFTTVRDIIENHVKSGYMPKRKEGETELSSKIKRVLTKCILTQYFGKLYNASSPENGTFLSEMFPSSCDK